jgi:hypothetical protein
MMPTNIGQTIWKRSERMTESEENLLTVLHYVQGLIGHGEQKILGDKSVTMLSDKQYLMAACSNLLAKGVVT